MFVFYDTETTGTNINFDQILQFAAILVDEQLREIDRFDMRCQILPWIVPSPMALEVTKVAPSILNDPSLPSFYEMVTHIRNQLNTWSPAIFVGYNSMKFDEPLLQRAFWQTLHPPYLTITGGNSRFDILPIVQAASHLYENILQYPSTEKGVTGFRLDALAPLNGFSHDRAHDALADVEATIFVANILKERLPDFWKLVTTRTSKSETANVLKIWEPILVVEYFANGPSVWFGLRIDTNGSNGTYAALLRLDQNWREKQKTHDSELKDFLGSTPKPIRHIAMNKAPLVFTLQEAEMLWGIQLDNEAKAEAIFLAEEMEFCSKILTLTDESLEPRTKSEYVEQTIFDGFPSWSDQKQMEAFHAAKNWEERTEMVRQFEDFRLRQIAQRLIYIGASSTLETEEHNRFEKAIAFRLHNNHGDEKLWRSIPAARHEIVKMCIDTKLSTELSVWLDRLEARFPDK